MNRFFMARFKATKQGEKNLEILWVFLKLRSIDRNFEQYRVLTIRVERH